MKKLTLVLFALILVLASFTACTSNNPPVITSLMAHPSSLAPGETTAMTCIASDPDGDTTTYTWSADDGTISGVGSEVNWVAPDATGTFTISVTVTDSRAETATESCYVVVVAAITPTPTPTPSPTPTPEPKQITDDLGRIVIIEEIPQRIVSLAPGITEILFALGLGNKVVGVTDYCDYPEEALDLPTVGGYFMTSLEAIIGLDPDIVFADGHDPVCGLLDTLGVTMVVLQPKDIAGIYGDIALVGKITGKEEEAVVLIADMYDRIGAVTALTAWATERPTVFYVIDASNPALPWTAGNGTFIDTLITLAGGENIASGVEGWTTFSLEVIVDRDPDMIIAPTYHGTSYLPDLTTLDVWKDMTAVKEGEIYLIEDDLVSRPGPRIVDGLEEMAKIIHPELFP